MNSLKAKSTEESWEILRDVLEGTPSYDEDATVQSKEIKLLVGTDTVSVNEKVYRLTPAAKTKLYDITGLGPFVRGLTSDQAKDLMPLLDDWISKLDKTFKFRSLRNEIQGFSTDGYQELKNLELVKNLQEAGFIPLRYILNPKGLIVLVAKESEGYRAGAYVRNSEFGHWGLGAVGAVITPENAAMCFSPREHGIKLTGRHTQKQFEAKFKALGKEVDLLLAEHLPRLQKEPLDFAQARKFVKAGARNEASPQEFMRQLAIRGAQKKEALLGAILAESLEPGVADKRIQYLEGIAGLIFLGVDTDIETKYNIRWFS